MRFDRFLSVLFSRGAVILLLVTLMSVATLSLSGCIFHDTVALVCDGCGNTEMRDSCIKGGEACDEKLHSVLPEGCIADCLFASEGATFKCGEAIVHCDGCNYELLKKCKDKSYSCGYEYVGEHYQLGCIGCTSYCDGSRDPLAPVPKDYNK